VIWALSFHWHLESFHYLDESFYRTHDTRGHEGSLLQNVVKAAYNNRKQISTEQESGSRFPEFLVKISTDYIEKFSMVYECKPANCDTNERRQHSPREPQHRDIAVDPKPPTPNNRPYTRKWPIAELSRQCNSLRATNTTVVAENATLRQQICNLKQLDEVGRRFPILSHHLESLTQSVDLLAPRYSATMKPFYILAASVGETLYGFLTASLAFHRGDKSKDIATVGLK
jgi:hypothetical protein